MKKIFFLLFCILSGMIAQAQFKVTFVLKDQTIIRHDNIFVSGSFNNWDSTANPAYLLKPHGEKEYSITLNLLPGLLRYRFHRGNWTTVEKSFDGEDVEDRDIIIHRDTILTDIVITWKDEFFSEKYKALSKQISDTSELKILASLAVAYSSSSGYYNADSAYYYAQKTLQLLQKMKLGSKNQKWFSQSNSYAVIRMQDVMAGVLHSLGNFPKALEMRLENVQLAEKEEDKFSLAGAILGSLGEYEAMKDYQNILFYSKQIDSVIDTKDRKDPGYIWFHREAIYRKAIAFYNLRLLDSALYYAKKRAEIDLIVNNNIDLVFGNILLADVYAALGNRDSAIEKYRYVIANATAFAGYIGANAQAGMAKLYQKERRLDSALIFALQALSYFQNNKQAVQSWNQNADLYISEIAPLVAQLYKVNNQPDSAYKYLQLSISVKDSLYNKDKIRQFQTLGFNEATRRQQVEQQIREEEQRYDTKIKMYGLVSIITGVVVLAFILYRNNRHKQKANTLLQSQKKEIEKTLGELKSTQAQLIQSEKMASLGELTAGIAHEIQNPLNFVNNFSDVNKELLAEMKDEMNKGNLADANAIANDVISNEEKINHHGKRADSIVKGMLQHSRSTSGQKEATDINALCDEYVRLSYHGLRAKDKTFNAAIVTNYDYSISKINIIPQDIGRVILNLLTNAFYAVNERKQQQSSDYEPVVSISTKKVAGKIQISVKDNGNGIPQKIADKIFQPFFTTKPTGQGTGLRLSLSYDIVTKGHGGELRVETEEGKGSKFIIQLPITKDQ